MRTTIRLPDDLYGRAKTRAAATGQSFTQFLEDAVRSSLALERASEVEGPYELHPLTPGHGLQAGVDLDDTSALLDRMEGR